MTETVLNMLAAIVIGFAIFFAIYAIACALTGRKM